MARRPALAFVRSRKVPRTPAMPPSVSKSLGDQQPRPIPMALVVETHDAATLQIPYFPQAPRACANTDFRFSIGAWRARRPNPLSPRAIWILPRDRGDRAGRQGARVVRARAYRP